MGDVCPDIGDVVKVKNDKDKKIAVEVINTNINCSVFDGIQKGAKKAKTYRLDEIIWEN